PLPVRTRLRRRWDVEGPLATVLDAPDVLWSGRIAVNPVHRIAPDGAWQVFEDRTASHPSTGARLEVTGDDSVRLSVPLSGTWVDIDLTLPVTTRDGGTPVVTTEAAAAAMRTVLAVAGGFEDAAGPASLVENGTARVVAQWDPERVADHTGVTAVLPAPLAPGSSTVP
ncbi:hypothetical protein H7H52_00100, partial [Mycolicibacter hiberniae]